VSTRNCEEFQVRIEDFIAGELDKAEVASVRAHLSSCADCRQFQALIERENEAYSNFYVQTSMEPSSEVWETISKRIGSETSEIASTRTILEGRERRSFLDWFRTPSFVRQFAAAAALVLISVFLTWFIVSRASRSDSGAQLATNVTPAPVATSTPLAVSTPKPEENKTLTGVTSVEKVTTRSKPAPQPATPTAPLSEDQQIQQQIARTEGEYLKAIRLLDRAIVKRKDTLDADTMAQYKSSLALIDDSIDKSRAALKKQPGDLAAGQFLLAAYARKVDVMQEIAIK